jgi:isocitrate/isopropylmalate dehydrogenase
LDTLHDSDGWILGPIGHMAYPTDDPKAVNPHRDIEKGMGKVLGESETVTPDLGGTAKTEEMGEAACQALLNL